MLRSGFPAEPHAGLNLKTGIIIMLKLGSQGQPPFFRRKGDLILDKSAEQLIAAAVRGLSGGGELQFRHFDRR